MSASKEDTIDDLKTKLQNYKIGDKLGLEMFRDADPGEMGEFVIRIGVFGQTGSGKSALINTVSKILRSSENEVAISQSAGGEGTRVYEELTFGGFSMFDTRGFFNIDSSLEETEFFRILYGGIRPGEDIDRGRLGNDKAKSVGIAAHKLNKPPLKRQLHVVLWVINANDIRFIKDDYQQRLNFILDQLKQEAITMVTVITHSDIIDEMDNASQVRKETIRRACDVTKSLDCHTFLVHNWIETVDELDEATTRLVLDMIDTALECGERSVKIRQNKRKRLELKAAKEEAKKEAEERDNKNMKYRYNNL